MARKMNGESKRPAMEINNRPAVEIETRVEQQVKCEVAYPCPLCFNTLGGVARRGPRKTMTLFYAYCTACPHSWVQEEKPTKRLDVTVETV